MRSGGVPYFTGGAWVCTAVNLSDVQIMAACVCSHLFGQPARAMQATRAATLAQKAVDLAALSRKRIVKTTAGKVTSQAKAKGRPKGPPRDPLTKQKKKTAAAKLRAKSGRPPPPSITYQFPSFASFVPTGTTGPADSAQQQQQQQPPPQQQQRERLKGRGDYDSKRTAAEMAAGAAPPASGGVLPSDEALRDGDDDDDATAAGVMKLPKEVRRAYLLELLGDTGHAEYRDKGTLTRGQHQQQQVWKEMHAQLREARDVIRRSREGGGTGVGQN
jgi:hypothetical protein